MHVQRPCPKRLLWLELRLDRADLDVAVAEVVVSDTARATSTIEIYPVSPLPPSVGKSPIEGHLVIDVRLTFW